MYVTKEQIRKARKADLSGFLMRECPGDVKPIGNSISLRSDPSLYIKRGMPGYHDFANGEHGNSIDFLVRHLGYSFTDAVSALCRHGSIMAPAVMPQGHFRLPPEDDPPFERVSSYLHGRGLPSGVVQMLFSNKLLYQDAPHRNAVFVTPERDYCEVRGTMKEVPFHGCRKARPELFWYLLNSPKPKRAYICEAAIDAISLMLIHERQGLNEPAAYVSIGGVANQRTIDRIKHQMPAVLAVDNDAAGDHCRERNTGLPSLVPSGKDWNEDLQNIPPVKM